MSSSLSPFSSGVVGGIIGAVVASAILISWTDKNQSPDATQPPTQANFVPSTSEEAAVVAAVNKSNPAVVSIVVTKDVPVVEQYFDDFSPFRFRVPQYRERGTEQREIGGGSGFLVSKDGLIITNKHVVSQENADYTVFTNDGEKHIAKVIARDPANDSAVLKIDAQNLPYLEFASSNSLQVGQTVIAIGNALGEFENTVSVGVISGLSRSIVAGGVAGQPEQLEGVIQTDAAINPGNSGGPLLNLEGKVIGVNVAVALGSENIGFALPSDITRQVVESVQKTGRISRPFLGVRYAMITPAIQQQNQLNIDHGALIVSGETNTELAVVPGSPAAQAGLQEGDVILEIDSTRLDENHSLASIIRTKQVGQRITLKVWRNGQTEDRQVTLQETPQ